MNILEKDCWLPRNFCALPPKYSAFTSSRAVILPIPYEQTTSYRGGTRLGPSAIIQASQNVELYDPELDKEVYTLGICTLPELVADYSGYENNLVLIEEAAAEIIRAGKFLLSLGGEHSVTLGLVRAFAARDKDFAVLQLDAHADLRDKYQNTPYNHACVMRRVLDHAPAVQVGIRSLCKEEAAFARTARTDIFYAHNLKNEDAWIEEAVGKLPQRVYVTIDLDVLDPSVMPAVGTPEPGGLGWYSLLRFLRAVAEKRQIIGCDLVELCPLPGIAAPDFLAAKLAYKLLGYVLGGQVAA